MTVPAEESGGSSAAYRPGWLDWLDDRVESWPGAAWPYYVALWVVLAALAVPFAWHDFAGTARLREALLFYSLYTGGLAYVFFLKHYLRSAGRAALGGFRPAFREDDSATGRRLTLGEAEFRLTNAPASGVLVVTFVAVLVGGVLIAAGRAQFQHFDVAASPASYAFNLILELAVWAVAGAAFYSFVRTLRFVARLYGRHAHVSLFNLHPLYAFSGLTLRYALGVLLAEFVYFSLEPRLLSDWSTASLAILDSGVALALFAAPLAGAHRLLSAEKDALLAGNSARLREVLDRLHAAAGGDTASAANIQYLLLGLEKERAILEATPTWPWRPGLFRTFLSALLLPVVIWLIQFLLGQMLPH